jgi:ribose/xylose/arabinose/galactoside ABC-type transport system permease subunit
VNKTNEAFSKNKSLLSQNGKKLSNETFINLSMFVVLIILFTVICFIVPNFFTISNIQNLVSNYWYIIILGVGVTFLLITGHFDMSIGGIIALAGVLSAYFCQSSVAAASSELSKGLGMSYGVGIALALLCCLGIGVINAFFIGKLKVASIIISLGTMSIARGIAQAVAQGAQRSTGLPDIYSFVGNASFVGSLKISVLIMIVIVIIAVFIEKKTNFGRKTYLIGANPQAARLSGIKVEKHIYMLYLFSSLLAGITGILLASEVNAGMSQRGTGNEFDALVIVLLGGTSINGGFGSVIGTVIGAFIIAVITSASTGMLLRPEWQYILKGVVTFLAIMAQRYALDKRNA